MTSEKRDAIMNEQKLKLVIQAYISKKKTNVADYNEKRAECKERNANYQLVLTD